MKLLVRIAGAVAIGGCLAAPLWAQHPPVPPSTWAIEGARIEPVSGPTIAKGTVVIREGLILAVGANVATPPDARVIDGTGLTVYPGFIDSYGSLGIPAQQGGGQGAQAAGRRSAANSRYATGLQSEVRASAELEPAANAFNAARSAGITAALTAIPAGVFRGSSALIALGDGRPAELVIRDDVAQHMGFSRGGGGFGGGGGGYPGSLLGVMAQMRQQLLDAAHWRDLNAAAQRNPRGTARPAHDPSLEALQPVIAGTRPVVIQANTAREIDRALMLAREFNLRPIIAGGREAGQRAEQLRAANATVLLDIDFPRRTAPTGAARTTPPADTIPESMAVLRSRVEMPRNAGLLAGAGVRFGFVSGNDYTDFAANVRRAVAAGLSREQAIRALTIDPATIFGVADRLGSIEPGKVANLTIVRGDILDDGARVTGLFIDGRHHEIAAPRNGTAPGRES